MTTENILSHIDPTNISRIHLLGVCGTGMGSFAGMLASMGYQVTGSDQNIYPPMSNMLNEWGIKTMMGYKPENLDKAQPDLTIVGNVIPRNNPEASAVRERGLPHMSFPAALANLCIRSKHSIVIVGTHGKTTTTALLGHVLQSAGRDPSFLIGGVSLNENRSFRIGQGNDFVIEGDEYDTAYFDKGPKFLHYRPQTAIFTSMEMDHADIYQNYTHYRSSFENFVSLLPTNGYLAVCTSYPDAMQVAQQGQAHIELYGPLDCEHAQWKARAMRHSSEGSWFDLSYQGKKVYDFYLPIGGPHNIMNAVGVIAVLNSLELTWEEIAQGLASFRGVKRRQEIRGEPQGILVIDDFAHHPTAVKQTLISVRARFPDRKIWAIFEPRSNTSRRNLHQTEYAKSFSEAQEVILANPLPSDRVPLQERLDVGKLAGDISVQGTLARVAENAEEIVKIVCQEAQKGDLLLVMSNGSFGGLVDKLLASLE
jgi:UDP-N-acetylmuramate: L-alanyl-gamma-D-glutamyl-meso-diaminopimelate ligase